MSSARLRRSLLAGTAVSVALLLAGCSGEDALETGNGEQDPGVEDPEDPGSDDEPADAATVTVGSANFPEAVMLANLYALALEDQGIEVDDRTNVGPREVYIPALQQGELDLVPEYTGSLLAYLSEDDVEVTETGPQVEELRELLEPDIEVLEPADAQNSDGWAVTRETAQEYGLSAMSDLPEVADELVAGGPPETRERPDGLPGLERVYGVTFAEFIDLDPGGPLTEQALESGDIDVARVFTAQAAVVANDWVVLEDDQDLFPAENIVPVIRAEVVTDAIRDTLQAVSDALILEELIDLNRQVEIENQDPDLVAEQWLTEQGLYGS